MAGPGAVGVWAKVAPGIPRLSPTNKASQDAEKTTFLQIIGILKTNGKVE